MSTWCFRCTATASGSQVVLTNLPLAVTWNQEQAGAKLVSTSNGIRIPSEDVLPETECGAGLGSLSTSCQLRFEVQLWGHSGKRILPCATPDNDTWLLVCLDVMLMILQRCLHTSNERCSSEMTGKLG